MILEQTTKRKLFTLLAVILFVALYMLIVGKAEGQVKQYRIIAICVKNECSEVTIGSIAIVSRAIYITVDGIRTPHSILHYFRYKHEDHYRIDGQYFKGWLIVSNTSARIELYGVIVKYVFHKKEIP